MSALQFETPKRGKSTSHPRRCTVDGCNQPGTYKVTLLGYPEGSICGKHRNEWIRIWDGALEPAPVEVAA